MNQVNTDITNKAYYRKVFNRVTLQLGSVNSVQQAMPLISGCPDINVEEIAGLQKEAP